MQVFPKKKKVLEYKNLLKQHSIFHFIDDKSQNTQNYVWWFWFYFYVGWQTDDKKKKEKDLSFEQVVQNFISLNKFWQKSRPIQSSNPNLNRYNGRFI